MPHYPWWMSLNSVMQGTATVFEIDDAAIIYHAAALPISTQLQLPAASPVPESGD